MREDLSAESKAYPNLRRGGEVGMAEDAQCCTDFALQFGQHLSGNFDLLGSMLGPFVGSSLQPLIAACDIGSSVCRETRVGKPFFQLALCFSKFTKHNFFGGHPAKLVDQTNL